MSQADPEPGYLRTSIRLFAFWFPLLVLARIIGKWIMSTNTADLQAWLNAEWISELVVALVVTLLISLYDGYRRWLGPSYTEREDGYEP